MDIIEIKTKIESLAKRHNAVDENGLDDVKDAEMLELEAEGLIIDYCENNGYQVHGFPHEKRESNSEEYDEDYFCLERFRMYLDNLAISHDDVAELMWHYVNSFWPDFYEDQETYIASIRHNLKTEGFYDISF